uniref:Uncharacterized protein n=1 Tax=Parascaris equorum TaxID=6256 RepID=A0A914RCN5_PAREQ
MSMSWNWNRNGSINMLLTMLLFPYRRSVV